MHSNGRRLKKTPLCDNYQRKILSEMEVTPTRYKLLTLFSLFTMFSLFTLFTLFTLFSLFTLFTLLKQ